MIDEGKNKCSWKTLLIYFSNGWNYFDLLAGCLFFLGLDIWWSPFSPQTSRILMALSLLIYYIRILHIFVIFKCIGPKLYIIWKMVLDTAVIGILLSIIMLAFAIVSQSILCSNSVSHFDLNVLSNMFRRAYWSLFGEFFLEDYENENPECGISKYNNSFYQKDGNISSNNTIEEPSKLPKYFGPLLSAVYLIMTNLLLFNVLIAMFKYAALFLN